jgi:brefeldin A-resistance guanine nucleotide exchange factor 1
MPHPEAARLSFDLITDLASEGPKYHVTMDNSSSLVLLLDEFATAAGIFTETQQFRIRRKEPMTSAK